ncbi:type II toxin-antitoxin system VapC family toxin [Sphingomonas sp. SUN039]|uniref:type II toxin-antitoxin system VapC family toxin n=1 Tax=Sphingomonas sp. SUN039 TaxID=2937787 RepID=UPI00216410B9|nr:type II toxin-antitoxin system VapC family toxin [Sphingomonas sp. SUN039]UVO53576.1 type II toxin-antitoxin system VapC family toxin [Sphingomonas sp. SUN039]
MILVDSNILIDILEQDPTWFGWSSERLDHAKTSDAAAITPVVVAEVGPKFPTLEQFNTMIGKMLLTVEPLTDEAAFAAGQAFREYRRGREGPKSVIADFLIGGQAAVSGATILTRDPVIYARFFPTVPLIAPV